MYDIFFVSNDFNKSIKSLEKLRDRFQMIKKASSIEEANRKSVTKFFWIIWDDIEILDSFNFDYVPDIGSQNYIHVFKNGIYNNGGVCLIPKNSQISKREIDYRYFINKKEVDIHISNPLPNYYFSDELDIVFISYSEPNADKNYQDLKSRFPKVKRIHGISGIHQAHIAAANISTTDMFWVVDGDAIVVDEFNFSYDIPRHDINIVHVWQSINPINGLIYGYGGVKLLPRKLTENMNVTSVDMTTSISNRFKPISNISNITAFNTDPFNTWKSAFRECVKLSSRIIDGQVDDDTTTRLDIWCTIGSDQLYGEYSIKGALSGKEFGLKNSNDKSILSKINDWEWLTNEFKKSI